MIAQRKDPGLTGRIALLAAGAALLAPAAGVAAPPQLRVTQTCETAAAAVPGTTTATIALTAGTDDASGQPNQVAALDFTLTFGAATFTVTGVRLAAALAAAGAWPAPDWDGSLFPGQPLPAGRIQVELAPRLALPLPVLPDGPVVEVDLAVAATAAPACAVLSFAPDSVVFSAPPVGQALAGGTVAEGGIELGGEVCDDCADNNGDGAVDLADARCGATGLTLKKAKATPSGAKPMRVTGELPGVLTSVAGGVRLTVAVDGEVVLCEGLAAEAFHRKKNGTFSLQGGGAVAKLVLTPQKKRGVMRVTAVLAGLAVPAGARQLAVSLAGGTQRFHGAGTLRPTGKKIVFP